MPSVEKGRVFGVSLTISAFGVVFQTIGLLAEAILFLTSAIGPGRSKIVGPFIFFWSTPFLAAGLAIIALGITGIALVKSGKRDAAAAGGMLLIAASAFAFPTFFGFFIGSALMFAGGVLALLWARAQR